MSLHLEDDGQVAMTVSTTEADVTVSTTEADVTVSTTEADVTGPTTEANATESTSEATVVIGGKVFKCFVFNRKSMKFDIQEELTINHLRYRIVLASFTKTRLNNSSFWI